jgi:magnesium-transporting ATPase (P-type)
LNNYNSAEHFINFKGSFWGRFPNNSLDEFKGDLLVSPNIKLQIEDNKQFLYRGSKLKNTSWVWGLVVYTGQCTKIMLNSKHFTNKISAV